MTTTRPRADVDPRPAARSATRPSATPAPVRRTLLALTASALGAVPLRQLLRDWGWLVDVWLTMIIVIGPAVLLRLRRPPGALDIWPGIALMIPWLTARFVPTHAFLGVIPTAGTRHDVGALMTSLHHTTRYEVAPVHSTVAIRLVLCALLGLLAALIDLVAVVGRRGALAGVPMLVAYTVSGAVPRRPVDWAWFVAAAIGFLILLGLDSDDELTRWGQRVGRRRSRARTSRLGATVSAPRIAAVAVVIAVVLPLAVPSQPRNLIADLFHDPHAQGSGTSGISPFAGLQGDLTRNEQTNLLTVRVTGAASTAPPFYLRYEVLDQFTASGWVAGAGGSTAELSTDGNTPYPTDPVSGQARTVGYTATITADDYRGTPPVFALPLSVNGLDSSARWDEQDQVVHGTTLSQGQAYTETFAQPAPTKAQLTKSPPLPAATLARYRQVPSLPTYVTSLVAKLTRGATSPFAKARALNDYFTDPANGFTYNLQTKLGDSGNALVDFLKNKQGFCQQYAAAMAVMLRAAGVPTRVALGYEHPAEDTAHTFTVTNYDAHAWVEAYLSGIGWVPFDPTPIAGLDGGPASDLTYAPHPYATGSDNQVSAKPKGNSASGPTSAAPRSSAPSTVVPVTAARSAGPIDLDPLWAALIVLAVLGLGLAPAGARLLRRRRRFAAAAGGDADALWAELSDTAVDLGYVWSAARTPRQVVAWLAGDAHDRDALAALATAVEQRRYALPGSVVPVESGGGAGSAALTRALRTITGNLRGGRSATTRLRARLWPASLRLTDWSFRRNTGTARRASDTGRRNAGERRH